VHHPSIGYDRAKQQIVFSQGDDQLSSDALSFDKGAEPPPGRIVRELRSKFHHIVNVIEAFPSHYPSKGRSDVGVNAFQSRVGKLCRRPMKRHGPKALTIVSQ
jgi:hypothetical protein